MSEACRSCRAPVLWLEHARTGKRAPIDAEPASDGNIVVDRAAGTYRVVTGEQRQDLITAGAPLHKNHFVTCAQAAAWKQASAARTGRG